MSKTLKISLLAIILAVVILLISGNTVNAATYNNYYTGTADNSGNGTYMDRDKIQNSLKFNPISDYALSLIGFYLENPGYDFIGWKVTTTGGTAVNKEGGNNIYQYNETVPTGEGDLRSIAQWEKRTLTYNNGNENAQGTMNVQHLIATQNPKFAACAFTLTGYDFIGWAVTDKNGDPVNKTGGNNIYQYNDDVPTNKGKLTATAQWKIKTFNVTLNESSVEGTDAQTVSNGTVTFSAAPVEYGKTLTITLAPATGYELDYLKVNNQPVTALVTENTYTTAEVTDSVNVLVAYKKINYNVTATVKVEGENPAGGEIAVTKSPVPYQEACTVTVTPAEGYEVLHFNVKVGENEAQDLKDELEADGDAFNYAITSVENTYTIEVEYKLKEYTMVFNNNEEIVGGTISADKQVVTHGDNVTLTLNPVISHKLAYLKVNGEDVTAKVQNNAYTYAVTSEGLANVEVKYVIKTFTITTEKVSGEGYIEAVPTTVEYGNACAITIVPTLGYKLDYLEVNGKKIYNLQSIMYIQENVTENYVFKAAFSKVPFTITVKSTDGAKIEPESPITVLYDENQDVKIKAIEGYRLVSVKVDGVEQLPLTNDTISFKNVTKDSVVEVVVEKIPFTLKIESVDGATIDPTGSITVYYGDNKTVSIKANKGYKLVSVKVNDKVQELPDGDVKLELENITEDTTVVVKVEKETYTVLEGEDQTWEEGKDILVRFSGDLELFVKLYINGVEVDPENYVAESGSVKITLKDAFLATLEPGEYLLTAEYSNGNTAETTFVIPEKTNNPNTGDNIALYVSVLAVAVLGIAVLTGLKKKNAKKN